MRPTPTRFDITQSYTIAGAKMEISGSSALSVPLNTTVTISKDSSNSKMVLRAFLEQVQGKIVHPPHIEKNDRAYLIEFHLDDAIDLNSAQEYGDFFNIKKIAEELSQASVQTIQELSNRYSLRSARNKEFTEAHVDTYQREQTQPFVDATIKVLEKNGVTINGGIMEELHQSFIGAMNTKNRYR